MASLTSSVSAENCWYLFSGTGLSELRNALCHSGRIISQDLKYPVQMLHSTALAECNWTNHILSLPVPRGIA